MSSIFPLLFLFTGFYIERQWKKSDMERDCGVRGKIAPRKTLEVNNLTFSDCIMTIVKKQSVAEPKGAATLLDLYCSDRRAGSVMPVSVAFLFLNRVDDGFNDTKPQPQPDNRQGVPESAHEYKAVDGPCPFKYKRKHKTASFPLPA
jgi:hypothetical protein